MASNRPFRLYVYPFAPTENAIRYRIIGIQWSNYLQSNPNHSDTAVLAPELPYTVIPYGVRQKWNISPTIVPASEWPRQRIPTWCGISCDVGSISIVLPQHQLLGHRRVSSARRTFPLLALLPQSDPQGVPCREAYLGTDFFHFHGLSLIFHYRLVTYQTQRNTLAFTPNLSNACGYLRFPESI